MAVMFNRGRWPLKSRWPSREEWPVEVLGVRRKAPDGYAFLAHVRGASGEEFEMRVIARDELNAYQRVAYYNQQAAETPSGSRSN